MTPYKCSHIFRLFDGSYGKWTAVDTFLPFSFDANEYGKIFKLLWEFFINRSMCMYIYYVTTKLTGIEAMTQPTSSTSGTGGSEQWPSSWRYFSYFGLALIKYLFRTFKTKIGITFFSKINQQQCFGEMPFSHTYVHIFNVVYSMMFFHLFSMTW